MIIIVIIIGRILGKNIVDPIEKLSLMAKNIGKLNFEKKGYRKSKDEIEELYKEIYRMSDNLEGIINLYKKELEENKNIKKILWIRQALSIYFLFFKAKTFLGSEAWYMRLICVWQTRYALKKAGKSQDQLCLFTAWSYVYGFLGFRIQKIF